MYDVLGEPIINICLTIQLTIVGACILAHLSHMNPLVILLAAAVLITLCDKGSLCFVNIGGD